MPVSVPKPPPIGDLYDCPATVQLYDVVYISDDNEIDRAICTDNEKKYAIGVVIEKPTTTSARILTQGRVIGFSGLTRNLPVFLSDTTLGGVTQTPPTGSGKWLQVIGMATAPDAISLEVSPPVKRN